MVLGCSCGCTAIDGRRIHATSEVGGDKRSSLVSRSGPNHNHGSIELLIVNAEIEMGDEWVLKGHECAPFEIAFYVPQRDLGTDNSVWASRLGTWPK